MTIGVGELASRFGLKTSALRYYEELGFLAPKRDGGGRRRYRERDVGRVALILFGRRCGFSLKEVGVLLRHLDGRGGKKFAALAEAKTRELDQQIAQARAMKRLLKVGEECGCLDQVACDTLVNAMSIG